MRERIKIRLVSYVTLPRKVDKIAPIIAAEDNSRRLLAAKTDATLDDITDSVIKPGMLPTDARGVFLAKLRNQPAKSALTQEGTASTTENYLIFIYMRKNILATEGRVFFHSAFVKGDFPADAAAMPTLIGNTAKSTVI